MQHALLATLSLSLLLVPLSAQRGKPKYSWKGGLVQLEHGTPKYGKHSLDGLPPGGTWRLGRDTATVFRSEVPLLTGGRMIPPGGYRAMIQRSQDGKRYYLRLDYAGWVTGGKAEHLYFLGKLSEEKPAKKLQVRFAEQKPAKPEPTSPETGAVGQNEKKISFELGDANRRLQMTVRFGPHQLEVPFLAFAAQKGPRLRAWELSTFAIPAGLHRALSARQQPIVLGVLHPKKAQRNPGKPPFFQLIQVGEELRLVPGLHVPTAQYGFGLLEKFAASWTQTSKLSWQDAAEAAPQLRLLEAKIDRKKQLILEFVCGKQQAKAEFALPELR